MIQFKSLLTCISKNTKINFQHLVQIRRCKMEREGYSTDRINWEHYAKVLEAKQMRLPE